MGVGCDEGGKLEGRGGGEEMGVEVEVQELPGEGAAGVGGGEVSLGMKGSTGGGLGSDVGDEMRDLLRWRQAKGKDS